MLGGAKSILSLPSNKETMLCKNCGINEREEPFGWCTVCLDVPRPPIDDTPHKKVDRHKARRAYRSYHKDGIPHGYHIHHIDKNPENNESSNLLCLSLEQHIAIHERDGDNSAVSILKRHFRRNLRVAN